MDKQIRYLPDYTAADISNLVRSEPHTLAKRRFKCMTLLHGSFYANSLIVTQEGTGYELKHNRDYVYSDIDTKESTKAGEAVANVIIILNNKLGRKFRVTYRAVGLPVGAVNESTVRLLDAPDPTEISDSYLDIRDLPDDHDPTFHYHSLTKIQQFQYMLFYLEKIRNAVLFDVTVPIRHYLTTVELIIQSLTEKAIGAFDAQLVINFREFKKTFDVKEFDVDRINNWGLINEQTADKIAKRQYIKTNEEGYLAMSAFLKFKNSIYESYLGSDYTQLGRDRGLQLTPLLETMADAMIGATLLFDSYVNVTNSGIKFDRMAYPSIQYKNSRWNVRKVSNSPDKKVSIYVATEIEHRRVFTGVLTKSDSGILAEWKPLIKPNDIDVTMKDIIKHAADHDNPHRDNAASVGLELVENLPPVTDFDILTDSNARKMMTWDMLDKYTRRFLLKNRPHKESQLETKDENIMRNMQVVFSPCGTPCGEHECKVLDKIVPITTTTTTTTTTTEAPKENYIGFYMEDYTNQQSVRSEQNFSVDGYNGSNELSSVLYQHPTYYRNDGTILNGPDIPEASQSVGQGWKHFNVHAQRYCLLYRNDPEGLNFDHVHDFNQRQSELEFKFLFRMLPMQRAAVAPFYFRVLWEVIGEHGEFDGPYGEDNDDPIRNLNCQDFDNYTPVSKMFGTLQDTDGPFNQYLMGTGLRAYQLYNFDNYEEVPTDIGEVRIDMSMFMNIANNEARVAARMAAPTTLSDTIDNPDSLGGIYDNPTPEYTPYSRYGIAARKGLAVRIRMHVHQVSDSKQAEHVEDMGRLASVEFTLASYQLVNPVMDWATEEMGTAFREVYALLNIVPVGWAQEVHHEICEPKNHAQ